MDPQPVGDTSQQHGRISCFDWQDFDEYEKLEFEKSHNLFDEYTKVFGLRGGDLAPSTGFHFEGEMLDDQVIYAHAHAPLCCKVYAFAQKYLATKLKVSAMQRLQMEFEDNLPYPDELLESLEYAFTKTECSEGKNDPLRELLVGYAFSQAKELYAMPKFHNLLAKYPELAIDMGNALAPFLPGKTKA